MQSVRSASSRPAIQENGPRHTRQRGDFSAKLRGYFPKLNDALCRWLAILGSLREHIRIEFSTEAVDLGPACAFQHGGWRPNTRTVARVEGIQRLSATRQNIDAADTQMFLAGFDAGEQYALDWRDSCPHSNRGAQHIQPQAQES